MLTLLPLLAFAACNDYLDIKPKGQIVPQTAEDYELMLTHNNLVKTSDPYTNFLTDDALLFDGFYLGLGDFENLQPFEQNLYTFSDDVFGESETDYIWKNAYDHIYVYNTVINNVLDADGGEAHKKQVWAEAKVGRAMEYLTLVNVYANHYDAGTATTDLGVPLITDYNNDDGQAKSLERATVQQVYDQICADLNEAMPLLPDVAPNPFRASKSAAMALLARAYLYMGRYDDALAQANAYLDLHPDLLDYTAYSASASLGIGRIDLPDGANNSENVYLRYYPYVFGCSGSLLASADLIASYDPADKRLELLFFDFAAFGLPGYYLYAPFIQVNIMPTTSELYLIAAECAARADDKVTALDRLNTLRDNRIEANVPLDAADADEALRLVLAERRRELVFIDYLRLADLKRLNREPAFAQTITRTMMSTGETFELQPNSPKYVLPIPASVMRFNSKMVQNER